MEYDMNKLLYENKLIAIVVVLTVMMFFAPRIISQERNPEFEIGLYGWLPSINGKLAFNVPGLGDELEVDPGTLIENLKFTAQGSFAVKYEKWMAYVDIIYLKEGKTESKTIDVGAPVNAEATFKLIATIASLGGAFEVVGTRGKSNLYTLIGVRYFYNKSGLSLSLGAPLQINESVEKSSNVWNGFVGAGGRVMLAKHWFIPYYLDIGGGGSKFTWQGMGGISYDWNWGSVSLIYRYLYFNQGEESNVRNLSMGGGELGVAFRF
jgi:hypothetical protein